MLSYGGFKDASVTLSVLLRLYSLSCRIFLVSCSVSIANVWIQAFLAISPPGEYKKPPPVCRAKRHSGSATAATQSSVSSSIASVPSPLSFSCSLLTVGLNPSSDSSISGCWDPRGARESQELQYTTASPCASLTCRIRLVHQKINDA